MPALEKKWLINDITVEVRCLLERLRSAKEHIEITIGNVSLLYDFE